jgi:stage II sporulation protein M
MLETVCFYLYLIYRWVGNGGFYAFLTRLNTMNYNYSNIVGQVITTNLKLIGSIWVLGLTVVGVPFIILLVFIRGFILGFTVGFLVEKKAWQGLVFAIFSVFPQNLLFIPALLVVAVAAVYFSTWLLKGNFNQPLVPCLIIYALIFLFSGLLVTGSGLIEAYLSPVMIRLILAYF